MHESFAPLAHIALPENRKQRSARLAQEVLAMFDSGVGGAPTIHRALEKRYKKGVCGQRFVSNKIKEHVENSENLEPPKPWNRWEPYLWQQDSGYLLRLDLISRTFRDRGLNEEEARVATQLEVSLSGLDLIAQWGLVEEYAYRRLKTTSPETSDLDLLVLARPWADDGEFLDTAQRAGYGSWPHIRSMSGVSVSSAIDLFLAVNLATNLKQYFSESGNAITAISFKVAERIMRETNGRADRVIAVQQSIRAFQEQSPERIIKSLAGQRDAFEEPLGDYPVSATGIRITQRLDEKPPDDWKSVITDVWKYRKLPEPNEEVKTHDK